MYVYIYYVLYYIYIYILIQSIKEIDKERGIEIRKETKETKEIKEIKKEMLISFIAVVVFWVSGFVYKRFTQQQQQ